MYIIGAAVSPSMIPCNLPSHAFCQRRGFLLQHPALLHVTAKLAAPAAVSHNTAPWLHVEEQHHPNFNGGVAERVENIDHIRQDSYTEKIAVRCYEVGPNGTASPETMANLLQEVACNHAQSVGFSTDGLATTPLMRGKRLIWVTTRMHIEVYHYPSWGDIIEIETWCKSEGRAGTRRDWIMTSEATRQVIGRATSTWVMMNQDTRRLSRVPDDVREEYEQYFSQRPRYAFFEENNNSLKKIAKLDDHTQHVVCGLTPRRRDLDMNQHVNNVTYIGWMMEGVPQEILDTCELHRITIDYKREWKNGDIVESLASLQDDERSVLITNGNGATHSFSSEKVILHMLRLEGSHVEINRGSTIWRPKPKISLM